MSMQDKRKHVRLVVNTAVVYVALGADASPRPALSRNISCGGLHLCLERQISVQDPIKLEIYLPAEEKPIKAVAQVAWQDKEADAGGGYNTGVKFTDISGEDRVRIARYVLEGVRRSGKATLSFWQRVKLLFFS